MLTVGGLIGRVQEWQQHPPLLGSTLSLLISSLVLQTISPEKEKKSKRGLKLFLQTNDLHQTNTRQNGKTVKHLTTRCRPSKGRRCIPTRCRHVGACWDLLEWFQLFSTSQNTSRIQFRTFLKIIQIFWFPYCSTLEDLSVDVWISNVEVIFNEAKVISALTDKLKFNFKFFLKKKKKKKKKIRFPCCSTHEDLSIDVSITNVGLIFLSSGYGQNSFSNFFEIKNQIFRFLCSSTRRDLSIDVSCTNVRLILTKLWWFLFSGYGQTDRVLESSHGNMSAHKKFQLKAQN